MSGDMRPYVVRQGDYLAKLAFVHGFDAEEVWNDAKNEEIRGRRPEHNILAPGDIVYLPVKKKVRLPIVKETTNKYVAAVPKTTVYLNFKDNQGPFANEPYVVEGLGAPEEGTTDGDGAVAVKVSVHVREFNVSFPARNVIYPVRVGDMDPINEPSGVRKRLRHLGFYYNPSREEPASATSDENVAVRDRRAIAAFQQANGLEPTGELDEATRAALVESHGS